MSKLSCFRRTNRRRLTQTITSTYQSSSLLLQLVVSKLIFPLYFPLGVNLALINTMVVDFLEHHKDHVTLPPLPREKRKIRYSRLHDTPSNSRYSLLAMDYTPTPFIDVNCTLVHRDSLVVQVRDTRVEELDSNDVMKQLG